MMKVLEHEHLLKLIDLQVNDENVEESDDDDDEKEDLVTQDEFVCPCKRCDQEINGYYRYYYKCIYDSCDYSLHKFCAEVPTTVELASHSHPLTLTLKEYSFSWTCSNCQSNHRDFEASYTCSADCYFSVDISCVVEPNKRSIHHPSHPHPLVSLISKPILCYCNACGKEHKGIFFQCTTCPNFTIHTDCAFLPKSLLIQHTTNDIFHHAHPLTLSYSFPRAEREAKYYPRCRVCDDRFMRTDNLWIYKCEKCIYYAHVDCATSRKEPFLSMLSRRKGRTVKNFEDNDYPDLFHLPFPDQTYSIPKQLFFKEIGPTTYGIDEVSLQHTSHHHELILVDTKCIDGASSSKIYSCHNPKKKIELLCSGCVRPIMEMSFYKCGAVEDESCNFALHEWCTRLPTKVDNHPGHPQHTLVLMPDVLGKLFNIFYCNVCHLLFNGYAYGCVECRYYVDVTCGFIPEKITHESHPDHLLSIVEITSKQRCIMCLDLISSPFSLPRLGFSCGICDVYIHSECALSFPGTITHPYDKHPMKLSYLPIENHKSEYFCEICEDVLNPHSCFYHCDVCAQSVHSACAPLILCCETETYSEDEANIFSFINVKFGSIHKIHGHSHPLSFSQGIKSDGKCNMCPQRLQYKMIFKCLECKFAIDYNCFRRLKNKP